MEPKVSVIVPVFNGEKYLQEALESILSQTYQNFEVLVVDDGSTDRSSEIIRRYSRIRSINQHNQGVAAARMRAISYARGELITFLDQDDLWPCDKLALQLAVFDQDPTCQCVIGKAEYFLEKGAPQNFKRERLFQNELTYLLGAVMAKKELFQRFAFSCAYQNGSDTDWFFRITEAQVPLVKLDATLLKVRIHDANQSHQESVHYTDLLKVLKNSIVRKRQTSPLVSVIIPVHNTAAFLSDALDSVLQQTYTNFEVLLIDDGSTDNIKEVLEAYQHKNLFYHYQTQQGIGSARNQGIKRAKGDYLTFLDADDQWYPQKLEEQLAVFQKDSQLDFLFGHVEHFYTEPQLQDKYRLPPHPLAGFVAGTLMARKNSAQKVGLFETTYKVGEFIEWCLRAKQSQMNMRILKKIYLKRRIHGENTTLKNKHSYHDYLKIIRKYKGLSFELQPV